MLEKLGGTKFLMTLIAMGIGTAVEILKPSGLGATFAGLLAGLVATYGVANTMITNKALATMPDLGEEPVAQPEVKQEAPAAPNTSQTDYVAQALQDLSNMQAKQGELILNIAETSTNTNKLLAGALNQR
jgi:hypothetical protein